MSDTVLHRLGEITPTDTTWKVANAVFSAIPGAPALVPYQGLPQVVVNLGGGRGDVAPALRHVEDDAVTDILWMSRVVDAGDKSYAIYTGVTSALRAFWRRDSSELDVDDQQRNDAVLKAFALAYMALKAFPGPITERVRQFQASPAGRSLLVWYAAIDVGLPFTDNALTSGGTIVDELVNRRGDDQLGRLGQLAGGRDIGGVRQAFSALAAPIRATVAQVQPHLGKVADLAGSHLPRALAAGDTVAGAMATAADVLPVYRLLGARLAAESAVVRSGVALP